MPKIKEIYLNKNDIANIRVPKIAIMTCPFLNFIQFSIILFIRWKPLYSQQDKTEIYKNVNSFVNDSFLIWKLILDIYFKKIFGF